MGRQDKPRQVKTTLPYYRGRWQISQAVLAGQIGLSQAAYSDHELGRSFPRLDTARRLAAIFGVPIEVLWPEVAQSELEK